MNVKWTILNTLRRRAGIELLRARKNPNIISFIENRAINTVLDVGANTGQFGRWLRDRGYTQRIISFEPVKEAFTELESAARDDKSWTVFNVAMGASSGVMRINVSKNSQFSSFNELTPVGRSFDPDAEFEASESVIVKTVDEATPSIDASSNVLLKIDTQGFEKPVLEGAKETLKNVRGVLLELPIVKIYENNWSFGEAVTYMEELGSFWHRCTRSISTPRLGIPQRNSTVCSGRPIQPSTETKKGDRGIPRRRRATRFAGLHAGSPSNPQK